MNTPIIISSNDLPCRMHDIQTHARHTLVRERPGLRSVRGLRRTADDGSRQGADTGFADQFYFSRLFKKKIGMPPLKYRQQQPIL